MNGNRVATPDMTAIAASTSPRLESMALMVFSFIA